MKIHKVAPQIEYYFNFRLAPKCFKNLLHYDMELAKLKELTNFRWCPLDLI